MPGLKVVMPSNPHDVKGLLVAAIRDDNPVIVFEHKLMYNVKGSVPDEHYVLPLGVAEVKRSGTDVTVIATSLMVHKALAAAAALEAEGISVEVVDPCSLYPLDVDTLAGSVRKTGRAVVVDEGVRRYGAGAELAAVVYENAFDYLDAPIVRVGGLETPMPFSSALEAAVIPDQDSIISAVRRAMR
jgi:pyruvate dehydrogenase E1 component beta subunit